MSNRSTNTMGCQGLSFHRGCRGLEPRCLPVTRPTYFTILMSLGSNMMSWLNRPAYLPSMSIISTKMKSPSSSELISTTVPLRPQYACSGLTTVTLSPSFICPPSSLSCCCLLLSVSQIRVLVKDYLCELCHTLKPLPLIINKHMFGYLLVTYPTVTSCPFNTYCVHIPPASCHASPSPVIGLIL